jgi:glycosyltransferase involved in cell wall biosynthesis
VKIGSHAPTPGSHSGVADYAEALIPALSKLGPVEANADVHLYHLGNNRLHAEIYARALATPGVAVLHDSTLHHFLLGTLSYEQYIAEWVFNYGEWRRELGDELWRDRARSGTDARYFQFPMLRRIVESSLGVIVHNKGAAAAALAHGANHVTVIPHFFDPPVDVFHPVEIADFRTSLSAEPATTVFGIFGYLRETKRVISCLASFRRLHAARPDVALLLAGEPASPDLNRLLETETDHPGIHRMGHLTERNLHLAAAAVDCGLNLRYPAAGETSGIAIRLMGIGKPVIGSDIPENADIPETAMLRVAPGPSEAEELFEQMALIAAFPKIGRQIGNHAAAHIRNHHAIDNVASQYWQALQRAAKLT